MLHSSIKHLTIHRLASQITLSLALWPSVWIGCQVASQLQSWDFPLSHSCLILFLDATSYFFFDLLLFWWSLSSNWESVNKKKIFWELACLKMSLFYCHLRHNSFKLLKTAPHWSLGSNVAIEYFPRSFFYLVNFWILSL